MVKISKIIFLDFDGVIVIQKDRFINIDPDCAKHLKRILDETGAFIVITSTWRLIHKFIELKEMLSKHDISKCVLGIVNRRDEEGNDHRGNEIDIWLHVNQGRANIDVKRYVILDDEKYQLENYLDVLVQTDSYTGMNSKHADQAIKILNGINLEDKNAKKEM